MPSTHIFAQARKKYLPSPVKLLFVTEAPPSPEENRYFFFEKVQRGDSLFLETSKVFFAEEVAAFDTVKALREEKVYFLKRFQEAGFHLIHAVDEPQPNRTPAARRNIYRANLPSLIKQILTVANVRTPIVLISAVVYEACYQQLRQAGFNILNESMIEFPNSGQQINFRRKLSRLLTKHQLMPEEI